MKTVILCGGFGTRIRDVAQDIPKPLIPIGRLPILWHIMKHYAAHGHKDFVLCLGYRGDLIKDFFVNYQSHISDFTVTLGKNNILEFHGSHDEADWRVTLADTGLKAMTGARVKRVQKYLKGEKEFFLTYGDGVSDINLDDLLKFHRSHGRTLTMTGVRPSSRWGEVEIANGGQVLEFNEKPQASAGLINGGFFVGNQALFNFLDDREDLVFEQEPLQNLVKQKELMLFEHAGFWQAMDTYRDFKYLNKVLEDGRARWITWAKS